MYTYHLFPLLNSHQRFSMKATYNDCLHPSFTILYCKYFATTDESLILILRPAVFKWNKKWDFVSFLIQLGGKVMKRLNKVRLVLSTERDAQRLFPILQHHDPRRNQVSYVPMYFWTLDMYKGFEGIFVFEREEMLSVKFKIYSFVLILREGGESEFTSNITLSLDSVLEFTYKKASWLCKDGIRMTCLFLHGSL